MARTKEKTQGLGKETVWIDIEKIKPYEGNPREISQKAIDAVCSVLQDVGWQQPIVVDENYEILVGHTRRLAAIQLGQTTVPCWVADDLTEEQKIRYRILDNKTGEHSKWDSVKLKIELNKIDLSVKPIQMNFNKIELAQFTTKPIDTVDGENEVPEVSSEKIVTRSGDIWICGNHRVMCGDSTNYEHVEVLFKNQKADILVTSPPYLQQRSYGEEITDWDKLMNGVFEKAPLTEDAQILVNLGLVHRDNEWLPYWDKWIQFMKSINWRRFGLYMWDQGYGLPGGWNGRLAPSFEMIFHFNKQTRMPNKWTEKQQDSIKISSNSTFTNKDGRSKLGSPELSLQPNKIGDSVIRVSRATGCGDKEANESLHTARFPVGLPDSLLQSYALENSICYEPFCGSGTTVIAAEKLSLSCYAMELHQPYVDVIVRRWQNFTGQKAVLESTGELFDSIAAVVW